ncbi:50S ribosomal protein L32 [Amygdalobacter indicium]|uniref:Large ribosomal subunit protein bL32 n=1 Tax=Amygdalobacter indicium TaxID=3029272 RepID=A0ABY8C5D4_9FIRM|nr:50S ribosomal protein L32 [Amygdalobacter indicium]WEG34295.1 50S ribosomal protein L32 [Amygdalobacter indicium]WEG35878.1 50S ribosomal protein L32 [Amygdalobacter indicium]
MAVPKRRWSKERSRRSRSNWKLVAPALVECTSCHELRLAHRPCQACGLYRGRQVIEVETAATAE